MTNLVLVNTMANAYFTQIMDELRQAQRVFRMRLAVHTIGRERPECLSTKRSFGMEILAYFR
jgi:hypothetical protein